METVVVTGGAGFLGSHLVALLLEKGHRVIAVDSLWTGSAENITKLQEHPNFTFLRHDVTAPFPESLEKATRIYNLACPASPKKFPKAPLGILETCYKGTKNALDLASKTGARVLLASTSEVYGDPLVVPQGEQYHGNVNPFGGRSCYDEGKRVAEALAYAYRLEKQTDVRIARIFNAYGPFIRPDDGRVVPNFIAAALRQEDIRITGDGSASRCFQYAGDCAMGLYRLMESSVMGPVNIGREEETTIGEMATMINDIVAEKTGRPKVRIVYGPKPDDDPYRRVPDASKARRELGHEAKVGLAEGLQRTVDWFVTLPEFGPQKARL
ncbi:UDP-glucuronic acid decarboxylase 4 [Colletotrichum trifolii]|uniref:UDP-glucuronic acid decarboxylase 1 n=1 Tax=Colletotrichum trifolii TaxID=5466 RepID=A0A4R8REH6_COLTR|nr:UDP-glucuronic acid decarboxylase 4 [Colletotrichum trifolii]